MKMILLISLLSGMTLALAQSPAIEKNNPLLGLEFKSTLQPSRGSEGIGGGHTVSCKGRPSVTLDYYNALVKVPNQNLLLDPEKESFESTLEKRLNSFQLASEDLELFENLNIGDWLEKTLHSIGEVSDWMSVNLKIIEDFNLIYRLPPNCKLEQAAAQEKNGNDIALYQNSLITNKLSYGQKKVLRVHEVFYTLVRRNLGINSKPVRTLLEKILLKEISESEKDRAIKNFIAEIKTTSSKHICQAAGYSPLFDGYFKFYKKVTKQLIFYGQTVEDAFQKLLLAQSTTGYIPCNKVGDGGNAIIGICLESLTLGENCK